MRWLLKPSQAVLAGGSVRSERLVTEHIVPMHWRRAACTHCQASGAGGGAGQRAVAEARAARPPGRATRWPPATGGCPAPHVGLGHCSAQASCLSCGERPSPLAMACRSEIEELKLRKGQKDTSRERKWTTSRAVRQGTGQDLLESGTGTGSKGQRWRGKNDARQRREIERVKILKKKGQERQKKGYSKKGQPRVTEQDRMRQGIRRRERLQK